MMGAREEGREKQRERERGRGGGGPRDADYHIRKEGTRNSRQRSFV